MVHDFIALEIDGPARWLSAMRTRWDHERAGCLPEWRSGGGARDETGQTVHLGEMSRGGEDVGWD
jgi:hypothetical protein